MASVPTLPRHHLLAFVALHHAEQKRKYTGLPYTTHLQNVAIMADQKCRFGYEIGLCHDLFEDTTCSETDLLNALIRFGYFRNEAECIVRYVNELTDVYTHEMFPQVNRSKRKSLESARLHKISYEAQTVKYCDLIDNATDIVSHDKGFGAVFLKEALQILKGMNKGNPVMYRKAKRVIGKAGKLLST